MRASSQPPAAWVLWRSSINATKHPATTPKGVGPGGRIKSRCEILGISTNEWWIGCLAWATCLCQRSNLEHHYSLKNIFSLSIPSTLPQTNHLAVGWKMMPFLVAPGVPFLEHKNSAGKFQGGSNAPLEGWLGSCTFRGWSLARYSKNSCKLSPSEPCSKYTRRMFAFGDAVGQKNTRFFEREVFKRTHTP